MSAQYQKFAGLCSLLTGIAGFLYLILFFVLRDPAALPPSLALLAVGVFSTAVLVGVYRQVRGVNEDFALLGLLLGIGGAGGAAVHAAFDLNNNLHTPQAPFGYANPIDPRGFLTFAITGLALIVLSWLILLDRKLPTPVAYIGFVLGGLQVLLYLAYLILFDAANPLVLVLVIASGLLQPVWYLWVGRVFLQMKTVSSRATPAAKKR